MTGGNLTNNPYLYSHVPYDPLKDFDAVTLGAETPVVLTTNPSVRFIPREVIPREVIPREVIPREVLRPL